MESHISVVIRVLVRNIIILRIILIPGQSSVVVLLVVLPRRVILVMPAPLTPVHCMHAPDHCSKLSEVCNLLVSIILLDHLLIVLRVFQLNMLIKTPFTAITLGTVVNRTLVMPSNLGRSPSMPLLLLIIDFKCDAQHVLMLPLVGL